MSRILVIDDHPSVRQVMEYYLPTAGHTVLTAADGPAGLRLASETPVDLVLLDLDMPRMTGFGVCVELKRDARLQGLPVILMTGRLTKDVEVQAQALGICLVIG